MSLKNKFWPTKKDGRTESATIPYLEYESVIILAYPEISVEKFPVDILYSIDPY